jgi:hypothetical protein
MHESIIRAARKGCLAPSGSVVLMISTAEAGNQNRIRCAINQHQARFTAEQRSLFQGLQTRVDGHQTRS